MKKIITISLIFALIFNLVTPAFLNLQVKQVVYASSKEEQTFSFLIPYEDRWIISYETLLFDTSDGDIDITQYAHNENSTGYYIRTVPKNQGSFELVDLKYDVSKLSEVKIVPNAHAYYDEFLTANGEFELAASNFTKSINEASKSNIVRIPSTAAKYNSLQTVKDFPQPSRTEMVDKLPPDPPPILPPTHHSIGFDATSNSGEKLSVSSYSFNHTCGAEANLLVFGNSIYHYGGLNRTVTGVTYNGVSMTNVRSDYVYRADQLTYYRTSLYFMYAPTTGSAKSVSVTYSGTTDYSASGVVSYSGAKQSSQPDAQNGAFSSSDSSLTASVNVTTVADNSWVFSVVQLYGYPSFSAANTQRWKFFTQGVQMGVGGSDTGPKTPAGSQTMSWTQGTGYIGWAISAASFAPAVAPTVTTPTATSITSTGATLGANVTSDGGATLTARGTCWATTATPRTNCTAEGGTTTGVFTHARTGMSSGTLIYYAGYATNSVGTAYSADGSFTTDAVPTNDSLTFTNPYGGSGNDAVADNATEWNFRAVVSDTDGYANLGTVVLRLANSSDNTTPFDSLKFTWTEATDAFSETADTQSAATITSTGANSTCATNTCTLDFKIKFNSSFSTQSTNYNAELYTTDDAAATDSDSYANFYQVKSYTAPTNDSLTFTNPYGGSGNDATADNATEWNFRAVVSDTDEYTNLGSVVLRLANSSDNTTPFDSLKFTWTEATDAFSETADTQSAAAITSTNANSTCATNTCTLDFKIKFNNNFIDKLTNYNAELYTTDDYSLTDEDSYAAFYQVLPYYASGEQYWISEAQDAGSGKTSQPNKLTASWTLDGTDNTVPKFQVLGSSTGAFAGEETIYPAGAGTYYQDGGTYDIDTGVEKDISSQVTTAYRYWKVKTYIDTGTDRTDTPSIQDIRLRDSHPLILQATNGQNVGIGTTDPGAYKLHVEGSMIAQSYATGHIIETRISPKEGESFEVGDLLSITEASEPAQATESARFTKSQKAYDQNIIGVAEYNETDGYKPVFAGVFETKVSTLSAEIKPGDFLTSSEDPGKAMKAEKAGPIIGKALEGWNGSERGKIMVFVNVSWYDPDIYLTDTGDLHIIDNGKLIMENDGGQTGSQLQSNKLRLFSILNSAGQTIQRVGAFAQATIADLTAGQVKTALISPLTENLTIDLSNTATTSGFGKLIIKGEGGQEVASIDATGNVKASSIEIDSAHVLNNATVSGELQASKIYVDEIVARKATFGELLAATVSAQNLQAADLSEIQNRLAELETKTFAGPATEVVATASAETDALLAEILNAGTDTGTQITINSSLTVHGQTSLADTTIAGSLNVGGSLVLADNSINSLTGPLYLNSLGLGGIDILAGKITIDTQGNANFEGNVTIEGTLAVNEIVPPPVEQTNEESKFGQLLIRGNTEIAGDLVASGSGTFQKIIIATDNSATPSAIAGTEITTNATAGEAVLPAGAMELTIKTPFVTDKTLVYVTPVSPTQNKVIYVSAKAGPSGAETGYFKVAIDTPIDSEIKFNWWIIN